jgi:hypothetical protein
LGSLFPISGWRDEGLHSFSILLGEDLLAIFYSIDKIIPQATCIVD